MELQGLDELVNGEAVAECGDRMIEGGRMLQTSSADFACRCR